MTVQDVLPTGTYTIRNASTNEYVTVQGAVKVATLVGSRDGSAENTAVRPGYMLCREGLESQFNHVVGPRETQWASRQVQHQKFRAKLLRYYQLGAENEWRACLWARGVPMDHQSNWIWNSCVCLSSIVHCI
jgi:hypothetical protein